MVGVGRQNKTEQILLRVLPSFKTEAKAVADAVGLNVTEMFEAAFEAYKKSPKVRAALTEASKRKPSPSTVTEQVGSA